MNSSTIALLVFACVFSSAMLGMYIRSSLPESHLKDDSLNIVKLATGLIATMSALVLGLLISSAKGSFDRINNQLVENAAKVVTIDHLLADYGPEARDLRTLLKHIYTEKIKKLTSGDPAQLATLDTPAAVNAIEDFQGKLWALAPRDEMQRGLRARMLQVVGEIGSSRELLFLQKDGSIPMPMLAMLAAWLAIIFAAFGLCSPRNHTTMAALFVGSLCASGAIFLILELDRPLDGWISIRAAPLLAAIAHLGG
jgi:hypothetical protein